MAHWGEKENLESILVCKYWEEENEKDSLKGLM